MLAGGIIYALRRADKIQEVGRTLPRASLLIGADEGAWQPGGSADQRRVLRV